MKALTLFWFAPKYQRKGKEKVEFQLRPLNQRTLYELQQDIGPRGAGLSGATIAFRHSVVGWRGLDTPFSEDAKEAFLEAEDASIAWTLWLAQIAAELYKRALLTDAEAKNS